MAYFAQAGSGQSHSHGGSRNEGAADTFGQGHPVLTSLDQGSLLTHM